MEKESLKQKLYSIRDSIIEKSILPLGFGILYASLTLAVNLGEIGLEAGLEAILRQPKKEYNARLIDKGYFTGLNTHADFAYGRFKTEDGKVLTLMDGQSVLDGKIFLNGVIPSLKVGENYKVTQRDDLISKILKAEQIKEVN